MAVDPTAGKIYWANEVGNTISFARLDGTGGGQLNLSGATTPPGALYAALLEVPSGAGAPVITGGSAAGSTLACSQGQWAGDLLGSLLYRVPQSFPRGRKRSSTRRAGDASLRGEGLVRGQPAA